MTLYFFSSFGALAGRLRDAALASPCREMDPIDHPAIAAMSLRELADLPLSAAKTAPSRRRAPLTRGRTVQ